MLLQYPNKPEQELNQILTYQVSLIMRQQQQLANQMQVSTVWDKYKIQPTWFRLSDFTLKLR